MKTIQPADYNFEECPECGAENINVGTTRDTEQELSCNNCDCCWTEIYTLTGVEVRPAAEVDVTPKPTLPWWGYLHNNGTIQAKRYFEPLDITEAQESDFVQNTFGPFEANNRAHALNILKDNFKL